MYRLLLVDDEPIIREGLKKLITWEEFGIEIVGQAASGTEALAKIRTLSPHIVITDVAMPNGNGIELIQQASELPDPPQFIVLSGYNNFDYVRSAMKAGAINYLLKPVNSDELKLTVSSTTDVIDTHIAQKQQYDQTLYRLRHDTLKRLLMNQITLRELRDRSHLLGLSFDCPNMCVGLIRSYSGRPDERTLMSCIQFAEKYFESRLPCVEIYSCIDPYLSLAFIIKYNYSVNIYQDIQKTLDDCAHSMCVDLHLPCVSAIGMEVSSHRNLCTSYNCAVEHLGPRPLLNCAFPTIDLRQPAQNIAQLLCHTSFSKFRNGLTSIVAELFLETQTLDYAKYLAINLIDSVAQYADSDDISSESLQRMRLSAHSSIYRTVSIDTLRDSVILFFETRWSKQKHTILPTYSHAIRFAVRYLNENYQEQSLSLKTLANTLHLNAAYLGRQFKSETGAFFTAYLTELRIQKSIELLQTTTLKTSTIGELVGFSTESHFFTTFKKTTGHSPSYYRKNLVDSTP